jgi:hypothetical protein
MKIFRYYISVMHFMLCCPAVVSASLLSPRAPSFSVYMYMK